MPIAKPYKNYNARWSNVLGLPNEGKTASKIERKQGVSGKDRVIREAISREHDRTGSYAKGRKVVKKAIKKLRYK